jgi:hypothetical protein
MKTAFLFPLSAFCAIILSCSPAPHDESDSGQKGVPAINARIWLAPFINNSNIASIEGWPDDSLQRTIIFRHFDIIEARLLSELRRCEKYGLYTMVDDSNGASMTMTIAYMPFSRDYDTVTIPVNVKIESTAPAAAYTYKFNPRISAYREMREKNRFYYVGLILMNYVNDFPYQAIAHLLYRSGK